MSHRFRPEAEAEYLGAIRFYESCRSGLGAALIAEFEHAVALAVERPLAWRLVHPTGIRRLGLGRFPYSVFYRPLADGIEITAFAHHRQRPQYWPARSESPEGPR